MDADAGVPTQVAVGDDDVVEEHGVQDYLSVIESPELDSKKTELITAMLRLETRPHVLKVFSERAMWRGQGEKGYFHGAPEDWNCVVAAIRIETLSALDGTQVPGSRGRPAADGAHLARGEHGLPAPVVGLCLDHKDALNAMLMLLDARSLACLSVSSPALPDRGARLRSWTAGAPRGCALSTHVNRYHITCSIWRALLRGPMSDRQLVSRTYYALADDDRLWEPHCRADPKCAKMIIPDMVESGGWRRFYATNRFTLKTIFLKPLSLAALLAPKP